MKNLLSIKEQVLLKKLVSKLNKISKFMKSEGMSDNDVYQFIVQYIFQIQIETSQFNKKLSKDFSSETEEETNSEASDFIGQILEIKLEKTLLEKISLEIKIEKILLGYLQKCCVEEQKLRNYLTSEDVEQSSKHTLFDFEKFRERILSTKYKKNRYQSTQDIQSLRIQPKLTNICSIKERLNDNKKSGLLQDSERQLDYMKSFEKNLTQSIKRTKMLRSMLQKQLSTQFSSPLNFPMLRGDDNEGLEEIY